MSGERGSVDPLTVEAWKKQLPEATKGYAPRDIYNLDETGLFFHALPEKNLAVKGSDCTGGKKSEERLTIAICVNSIGEFEKPFVIGHAMKPRCFKHIKPTDLPVTWTANKKAWMTAEFFTSWVTKFN